MTSYKHVQDAATCLQRSKATKKIPFLITVELSPATEERNEDEHSDDNLDAQEQHEPVNISDNVVQHIGVKDLHAQEQKEPVKISDKVVQHTSKKRPGIKGSAREDLLEDMEFSLIKNLNERVSNKRKAEETKEESKEDLFCRSLAADLKDLPCYERCLARNEIRNVVFKYQMSVMNKQHQQANPQTAQYGFMQYTNTPLSNMSSPPATPGSWVGTLTEQDSFS